MKTQQTTVASPLRRALLASVGGQALEWYDFALYGLAAALVFPHVFFPGSSDFVGTLASFGTFAVGFIARPIGGVIFGRLGDKIGRSPTLIITILLMGISTVLIGVLPDYHSIGMAAPILLVVLRVAQGVGVGGEWSGAAIVVCEYAPEKKRGFFTSMINSGEYIGLLPATALFTFLVTIMPDDQFQDWGWRIPFLLSAIGLLATFIVRRTLDETPEFKALEEDNSVAKPSLKEALQSNGRNIFIVIGIRIFENASAYLITAFAVTYAEQVIGVETSTLTMGVFFAGVIAIPMIPLWGALSDRIGRKKIFLGGLLFLTAFYWPFFLLLGTNTTGLIWLAFSLAYAFGMAPMLSVEPAWFAELFPTDFRYSGTAISANVASVVAGGIAPLVAISLLAANDDKIYYILGYIGVLAVITLVAVLIARETSGTTLVRATAGPKDGVADASGSSVTAQPEGTVV
ncbi:MFS transporter [Rhodococcus sp. NPDC056960]|uniref:MFS transporter n=1 Tax=Rhodococcus sp. NPDC056960 TaxID=3345982 RepID=UPI0036343F27